MYKKTYHELFSATTYNCNEFRITTVCRFAVITWSQYSFLDSEVLYRRGQRMSCCIKWTSKCPKFATRHKEALAGQEMSLCYRTFSPSEAPFWGPFCGATVSPKMQNVAESVSVCLNCAIPHCVLLDSDPRPPPIIYHGPQNQTLPTDGSAVLPCLASGQPAPRIIWMKGRLPLSTHERRLNVAESGSLEISGTPSCRLFALKIFIHHHW